MASKPNTTKPRRAAKASTKAPTVTSVPPGWREAEYLREMEQRAAAPEGASDRMASVIADHHKAWVAFEKYCRAHSATTADDPRWNELNDAAEEALTKVVQCSAINPADLAFKASYLLA